MRIATLERATLGDWLRQGSQGRPVYIPVRRGEGAVFGLLEEGRAVSLDIRNTTLSVKSLFFPPCEVLLTFRGEHVETIPKPTESFVVFGVRPCDAQALDGLDCLFGQFGRFPDPYYLARRERAIVITLSCVRPAPTCFCTAVGGDPAGGTGADVTAFDLGDILVLEAVTVKGEMFLTAGQAFLRPASPEALERREIGSQRARERLTRLKVQMARTQRLSVPFEAEIWSRMAETCWGCGLCTHVCPTCHCFDITDERKGTRGQRVRTWDSCQYALFTLHASGHNPRPSHKERFRQRILHKFQYAVDNLGTLLCVGCGRCVAHCPAGLDVREMLERLTESGERL